MILRLRSGAQRLAPPEDGACSCRSRPGPEQMVTAVIQYGIDHTKARDRPGKQLRPSLNQRIVALLLYKVHLIVLMIVESYNTRSFVVASEGLMEKVNTPHVTDEGQQRLAETLGVGAAATENRSLTDLGEEIEASSDAEFATVGDAIRSDLEGELDADLLASQLEALAAQIRRLPEVREAGIPEGETEPERLYRDLIDPAWRVYDHLLEAGFFGSVDENIPRFTADTISDTAREVVRADPLTAELAETGFDDEELTALVTGVVNNDRRLSRWVPTSEIPDTVEFDVEDVPPLHQRAMGGALLWIKNMDVHLWQKSVLITDGVLDDACWDVKAMLGGLYLLTRAALEVAEPDRESLTNSQLTAALTASAAIAIVNQEAICQDAFRITDEMRAPSDLR